MRNIGRRPNIFDIEAMEEWLVMHGCPESNIGAMTSEMRLIIPLLLRNLGEKAIVDEVGAYADEFGLKPDFGFTRGAAHFLVEWATEELARYKKERLGS